MTTPTTTPCACGAPREVSNKCRACYNAYMKAYMARRRETTDKRILKEETLRRTYNLSMERYEEILANQGGVCGICGSTESGQTEWFEVDHDHACCDRKGSCGLCVRGLLCTGCNSGLSRFRDDPALLRSAADYLENRA